MRPIEKVIVIGLDGLEPTLVEPMLAEGKLPNLARLISGGGWSRVGTTHPAQTPVAWSTFATGVNPGGHGIFDFIRRDPRTYLPDLALNRYEQKTSFLPPKAVNLRRGAPLWGVLAAAGVPATVLRCPCTYPPDSLRGRLLSGMGVPDLRGGLGTSTFYTTTPDVPPEESENVVTLAGGPEAFDTRLIGPRDPKGGNFEFPFRIQCDRAGLRVTLRSEGQPRELTVELGRWSGWLRVKFKVGLLQSIRGMVRFHLVRLEPALELYASPINFDPDAPMFPISHPAEYAGDLMARIGPFHTTGMVEDHGGLNNGRFDEAAYLAQCDDAWREREAMLFHELSRFTGGLLYCLFDTPDRLQHMFWRFREPQHPANRRHGHDPRWAGAIDEHYRRCDTMLGRALEAVDDRTLCIALSDHGFSSFQRGVNLNRWLYGEGLLTLQPGQQPGESAGDLLRHVDWPRTKAYALGIGGLYLNVEGREAQGAVAPIEAPRLARQIAERLTGLRDPQRQTVAVRGVKRRDEIYAGPYAEEAPDLVVNFSAGYRASWATALGGVPDAVFEDNDKRWGGDHIIDPELVPGMLAMNRPYQSAGASLLDLAPTILAALNVPAPPVMEGRPLLR